MESTGNPTQDRLRARLAEVLVAVADMQLAHRQGDVLLLRGAAVRMNVACDDLIGLCDTLLWREDNARWMGSVDRAIKRHTNGH